MGKLVRVLLLAEAFAVTSYGIGWWSVPIVAAAWALFSRDVNRARVAALCAAGGWATLLLLDVAKGPVAAMASRLGGVMGVPSVVLLLATLVFPALLAWSAAALMPRRKGAAPTAELPA
jgi:hypothetical protein